MVNAKVIAGCESARQADLQPATPMLKRQWLGTGGHRRDGHSFATRRRGCSVLPSAGRLGTGILSAVRQLGLAHCRVEVAQIEIDSHDTSGDNLQLHGVADCELVIQVVQGDFKRVTDHLDAGLPRIGVRR
jgi:hypothetical protein